MTAPSAKITLPPGAPAWITPALFADTIATWQPYQAEPLTPDDVLEILLNTGNLVSILWENTS